MTDDKLICIAKIGKAHGIRGMVYLSVYTEDTSLLLAPNILRDKDGDSSLEIEEISPHKNGFLAKIKNVYDRNMAEELCHKELYILRDELKSITDDDDFYYVDLIGLAVFLQNNDKQFGKIINVHNFGAGDLIEIMPENDGDSFFLPFTKAFVPDVNMQDLRVTISPPDDFIDT